jgi:hypothetical protein
MLSSMDEQRVGDSVSREQILAAMAAVVQQQSRVSRAEASLAAARQRLDEAVAELARLSRDRAESLGLPPLAELAVETDADRELSANPPRARRPAGGPRPDRTLRDRIVATLDANPEEVFWPARLAAELEIRNRDSIRNTLLVLAARGRIEKVGEGRYRSRRRAAIPRTMSA